VIPSASRLKVDDELVFRRQPTGISRDSVPLRSCQHAPRTAVHFRSSARTSSSPPLRPSGAARPSSEAAVCGEGEQSLASTAPPRWYIQQGVGAPSRSFLEGRSPDHPRPRRWKNEPRHRFAAARRSLEHRRGCHYRAILEGRQPPGLTAATLLEHSGASAWPEAAEGTRVHLSLLPRKPIQGTVDCDRRRRFPADPIPGTRSIVPGLSVSVTTAMAYRDISALCRCHRPRLASLQQPAKPPPRKGALPTPPIRRIKPYRNTEQNVVIAG